MRVLSFILLLSTTPLALASAACWEQAAAESGTSVALLQAIARTESSMRPYAVNASHQHITKTRDIGLVGINTDPRVLKRLGVSEAELFDPCINLRVGARILREKITRHGTTWEAVGAYNASCTRLRGNACQTARKAYAWRVYRAMHPAPRRTPEDAARSLQQRTAPLDQSFKFVSLR